MKEDCKPCTVIIKYQNVVVVVYTPVESNFQYLVQYLLKSTLNCTNSFINKSFSILFCRKIQNNQQGLAGFTQHKTTQHNTCHSTQHTNLHNSWAHQPSSKQTTYALPMHRQHLHLCQHLNVLTANQQVVTPSLSLATQTQQTRVSQLKARKKS